MAISIPGLTPGQYYPAGSLNAQGLSFGTPRDWSRGGMQYYDPKWVRPLNTETTPQTRVGGTTPAPLLPASAYNVNGFNSESGMATPAGAKPGGGTSINRPQQQPAAASSSALRAPSGFPQPQQNSFLSQLFQPQSNTPQYQTHSRTGNPIVPGYTDIYGKPMNGRPAGTVPVFGDSGVWTGNWEMAGSPSASGQRPQPYAWTAAGRAQQAASQGGSPTTGGGTFPTFPGGTNTSIGGGITGGNITGNDLGYVSSFIGGSGQMPIPFSSDAQREIRQTSQDVARQEGETAALDVNRRGAYEQSRMDLARQMAEAESALGYGGLAARLYEMQQQRAGAEEGYLYDLLSSVL